MGADKLRSYRAIQGVAAQLVCAPIIE